MLSLPIAIFPFIIVVMLLGINLLDIYFFRHISFSAINLFWVMLINSFSATTSACLVLLLLWGKYVIVRNYLFFKL